MAKVPVANNVAIENAVSWAEALAAWESSYSAMQKAEKRYRLAGRKYEKAKPDNGPVLAAIKKEMTYANALEVLLWVDLEELWAQFVAGENRVWYSANPEARKATFRKLIDSIAEYREADNAAGVSSGHDAAHEKLEKLCDAESEARTLMFATPADDAAGAYRKLDLLFGDDVASGKEHCSAWTMRWVAPTLKDAQRFLAPGI